MSGLPFFLRRPWLVIRGTFTNRDTPDLAALRAIEDPAEFVWTILPHAARSFATSILVLPRRAAWAAAIAYLECRILDTYEDLHPDVAARPDLLRRLGRRWRADGTAVAAVPPDLARNDRDRVHLLLVERMALVDAAYATLSPPERESIAVLVGNMAEGMAWAAETFEAQNGVLLDAEQRARYCHHVIGEPALYAMRSLLHVPVTESLREDALAVSVMIQLANITRDIERDLVRGIVYHPDLAPYLGATSLDETAREAVRRVRSELLHEALPGIDAYRRLVAELPTGISQARGAAVLMLAFTDRYYSGCARRAGYPGWGRPPRPLIYLNAILATMSPRWADRILTATANRFHQFLEGG